MPFGGLQCTETYEAQTSYCHRCSNCAEFLYYKAGMIKYKSLATCWCTEGSSVSQFKQELYDFLSTYIP